MPSLRPPTRVMATGACALAFCFVTAVPALAAPAADNPGNAGGNSTEAHAEAPGQVKQLPAPVVVAPAPSGGANVSGPFDSTSDGSPSLNGNGGGLAVGKPCAGCVGNADDKNPPGQVKNDKDKGYECDDNNGVGKGNPAHSSCVPTEEPPGEEPPGEEPPGKPGEPGKPGTPGAPGAETAKPASQEVVEKADSDDSDLAFTGASVIAPALAGLALVGAGGTAVLVTRRRRTN